MHDDSYCKKHNTVYPFPCGRCDDCTDEYINQLETKAKGLYKYTYSFFSKSEWAWMEAEVIAESEDHALRLLREAGHSVDDDKPYPMRGEDKRLSRKLLRTEPVISGIISVRRDP